MYEAPPQKDLSPKKDSLPEQVGVYYLNPENDDFVKIGISIDSMLEQAFVSGDLDFVQKERFKEIYELCGSPVILLVKNPNVRAHEFPGVVWISSGEDLEGLLAELAHMYQFMKRPGQIVVPLLHYGNDFLRALFTRKKGKYKGMSFIERWQSLYTEHAYKEPKNKNPFQLFLHYEYQAHEIIEKGFFDYIFTGKSLPEDL